MSVWSQPYLTVHDATGARVAWQLPDPLPWVAGATFDANLRTPVPLGLPTGGTVKVRWRTPEHANARSRTRPTSDLQTVALACDVLRAAQARGHGWVPDDLGWGGDHRGRPVCRLLSPSHVAVQRGGLRTWPLLETCAARPGSTDATIAGGAGPRPCVVQCRSRC